MAKINCWEFMKCERGPGGKKVKELGQCPAALEVMLDGLHGGRNGGRACWAVSGTYCRSGKPQGVFAAKAGDCMRCPFFDFVHREEGKKLKEIKEIIRDMEK